MTSEAGQPEGIAVIGMAGRFPGADNPDALWKNLRNGVDCISRFAPEELEFSVEKSGEHAPGDRFVRARGILEQAGEFDAEFFGVPPGDAILMDPQHRIFLECCWEAIESAGYVPSSVPGLVGVYGGIGPNTYLLYNLNGASGMASRLATRMQVGEYAAMLGNDKDFVATRVAHKLGLRGPAMAVQTACSTSLVAICQACSALETYQCDSALAGGVSITFPQKRDYLHDPGGMVSGDGFCRAFDAGANGTVFSHGAATVYLKRLPDALRDRDPVLAVIRGWAVNNDGRDKLGFAAPGVAGQSEVIAMAYAAAGIDPSSISYVEAHGTGTPLGDPAEVLALTKAFREGGASGNGFCLLGTGKTHIGHMDVASGAAGLVKTILQLQHGIIPPLLHFLSPNPAIRFEETPFVPVATETRWEPTNGPRRAGVSSFGVGGTNAHVVVEEAPALPSRPSTKGPYIFLLSARTPAALDAASTRLAEHLENVQDVNPADVAFTLACGRRMFACRRAVLAREISDASDQLRSPAARPELRDNPEQQDALDQWLNGEETDWAKFYPPAMHRRVSLPTYPFERKKFWVSPKQTKPGYSDEEGESASEPAGEAAPAMPLAADPQEFVKELVEELSGRPIPDPALSFEALGFDSLFLAQIGTAVYRRSGVQITFRQLLGDSNSITKLAQYVAAHRKEEIQTISSRDAKTPGARLGNQRLQSTVRWPGTDAPGQGMARIGPYRPLEKTAGNELPQRQRQALDALIARYTAKTAKSKAYTKQHRPHFADPRAVAGFHPTWKEMVYPIVSSKSAGAHLWDIDGNRYIDITMGFGTYLFGHSPPWLLDACARQLSRGIEIGPQSPAAGEIARRICLLTGMERTTFCNTGSEAVMAAMRLARAATGRDRIACFSGAYHGMFDEVLVRGAWNGGEYRPVPAASGIPPGLIENMLVLPYGAPESLEILRALAHELAAVLVEPVQSRNPGLQPKHFLHELRLITGKAGTALVFDEVVTGFRCHPGGAQAYFGIKADLATYGKVVGGGIPIGILAGSRRFMDILDGGPWDYGDDSIPETPMTFFAGTFVRHPLAMAAAQAVLDRLFEGGPGLQLRLTERTARFCRTIEEIFRAAGVPLRMPCFSACAAIEVPPDMPFTSLLWYFLREKGVHVWENRPIFLTLAHSDEDLDKLVHAFAESIGEMQAGGFLPPPPRCAITQAPPCGFPVTDSSPVTEAQQEILAAVQMGDDANRAFNESVSIEFHGELDVACLEKSVLLLLQRHPALRSTFTADGNSQIFSPPPGQFSLEVSDLSALDGDEKIRRYEEMRAATTGEVLDLVGGPLLRLHLVRLAPDRSSLLFLAHHLVCDGWSLGMLVDELCKSYNAYRAGSLPMLPPPKAFGDYARRLIKERESTSSARDFWVQRFATLPPPLDLPLDRPRPPLKTYSGAMEVLRLGPQLLDALRQASPSLGGTIFSTLLAAFTALLHRLTGQEDMVIGVPAADQVRIGCDELVGHCLNFLPLRLRCSPEQPFVQLAGAVKQEVIAAYENQNYTFGSLVRKLRPHRDRSRVPLVSAMFNIDRSGFERLRFDGLDLQVLSNAKQFVNFDLFFNLNQTDEFIEVECEYNTDLFDFSTIRRWLDSFEALVAGALAKPEQPIQALPAVGASERRSLLAVREKTRRAYSADLATQTLLSRAAQLDPDKNAVVCGECSLSYRELEEQSDRIAAVLLQMGVHPGDRVGVFLRRSVTVLPALLGAWKCGAAYVPMDPCFPPERLRWMIEDAHFAAVLTERDLSRQLPVEDLPVLFCEEEMPAATREFVRFETGGEHPAYILFTSGSTGRPKGVVVPHRALVNFLESMRAEPGMTSSDVLLAVTTLSFDISALELFLPLLCGATVAIVPEQAQADGFLLAQEIRRHQPTWMQATPATWRLLLEAGWEGNPDLKILIGGEAVPRELVNRLAPLCREIWNVYGPTETTIWSTTGRLTAGDGPVSIGHPIANTTTYVLSGALELQPAGAPGELFIGGAGLALGYLGHEDLTRAKFLPDPFGEGAEKLFRTGDLAKQRADGSLLCLGRLDGQAKVRGFRIELGEIESQLETHPLVAQAICGVYDGRLAAHIRPTAAAQKSSGPRLWQDQWDLVFQTALAQGSPLQDIDATITGWTGIEDARQQVAEWIDATLARIRLLRPRKVLEIGCGTGQILSRLAPEVEEYWGTDISRVAIEALGNAAIPGHVKLLCLPADDFTGLPEGHFDTVVINSVAQYFPDAAYLRNVLESAARCLSPGGRIFLGDNQGSALLAAYHAWALAERTNSEATCGSLLEQVRQRLEAESELAVDPGWFDATPIAGIACTEVLLRRGQITNETTTIHYDAILYAAPGPALLPIPPASDWPGIEGLAALLRKSAGKPVAIPSIPDARLTPLVAFWKMLQAATPGSIPPAHPNAPAGAATSEQLHAAAESCGFRAHVRWQSDGTNALIDVCFVPEGVDGLPAWPRSTTTLPAAGLVNSPRQDAVNPGQCSRSLRAHLASVLPDYMIPSTFIFVDSLPLTPNGKVDRSALVAPSGTDLGGELRTRVAPRNEIEKVLWEIWSQVLGNEQFGVEDDIFDLGADSIMVFQIATRVHRAGWKIPPAQIFRVRNIAALARQLDASPSAQASPQETSSIPKLDRRAYLRK